MKARVLGGLLVVVLLLHGAALLWLRGQLSHVHPLVPMATPLLTRSVTLQAPVPPSVPVPVPARSRPSATQQPVLAAASPAPAPASVAPETDAESAPELPDASDAEAPDLADRRPSSDLPDTAPPPQPDPAAPPATPSASAALADWPPDTRVSYRLKGYYRGDVYGAAQVQWQRRQTRYEVRVDLRMALLVTLSMISQGEVSDAALLPRAYEERFMGEVRRIAFDPPWVRFDNGSTQLQPPVLQDSASQFVELSRRFSSGRETPQVGGTVQVWLARPLGLALWTYDVMALETLQTPGFGAVSAYHLKPRPIANPRGLITAEMWFAPGLQYLPVRVRIALGADNYLDLLAEGIEQGPAAASGQAGKTP